MIDEQIGADILAIAKEINKYAKAVKDGDTAADRVRRRRAWMLINILKEYSDSAEKSDMHYELWMHSGKTEKQAAKHSYSNHVYYKDTGRLLWKFKETLEKFDKQSVQEEAAELGKPLTQVKPAPKKASAKKAPVKKVTAKKATAKKATAKKATAKKKPANKKA